MNRRIDQVNKKKTMNEIAWILQNEQKVNTPEFSVTNTNLYNRGRKERGYGI